MGAVASAASGVSLLGPLGLGQQVGAAEWWFLQDGPAGQEPSAAVHPPVTAAWGGGRAAADRLKVSGGGTAASELEGNLPGFAAEPPDLGAGAGLQVPG